MKFEEITKEEYQQFLASYQNKNFLQDSKFATMRNQHGWCDLYVGVRKDDELIASSMLLGRKTHFGRYEFYSPRGLIVDYLNEELVSFFTLSLKTLLKKKKAYVLRIDPYFPLIERDIEGKVNPLGYNHEKVLDHLLILGYKKKDQYEQVHFMFVLDLDISRDELLKRMRQFTRRNITKGLKNGITIRKIEQKEIPLLKDVLDSTSNRKHFANRSLDYFKQLYTLFSKEEAQFLVAEIELGSYLSTLKEELEELTYSLNKITKENKRVVYLEKIDQLKDKIKQGEQLREEKGDKIILSGGIFFTYGGEVTYLFGGNYKEYMSFCAPYVLQWHMICYAMDHQYKRYNFYGISGNFDKEDKDYGIYDFKKGFTGYVEELIGEFELPIDRWYSLFGLIRKIRK